MDITINKSAVKIIPSQLEKSPVSFSFSEGREFNFGDKKFKLNQVIKAVTQEALKPGQNADELKEWSRVFTQLTEKGYKESEGELSKSNLLTRLISKIKHAFSSIYRNKLLKKFNDVAHTSVPTKEQKPSTVTRSEEPTSPEQITIKLSDKITTNPPEDKEGAIEPESSPSKVIEAKNNKTQDAVFKPIRTEVVALKTSLGDRSGTRKNKSCEDNFQS